jgi:hypothetical protein
MPINATIAKAYPSSRTFGKCLGGFHRDCPSSHSLAGRQKARSSLLLLLACLMLVSTPMGLLRTVITEQKRQTFEELHPIRTVSVNLPNKQPTRAMDDGLIASFLVNAQTHLPSFHQFCVLRWSLDISQSSRIFSVQSPSYTIYHFADLHPSYVLASHRPRTVDHQGVRRKRWLAYTLELLTIIAPCMTIYQFLTLAILMLAHRDVAIVTSIANYYVCHMCRPSESSAT